eukprot:419301-Pyramimonas_sp.AAC.1
MRNVVMSLFETLEVRALNTYNSSLSDSSADPWTCGVKREAHRKTQIDYIGVSALIEGEAAPVSLSARCFTRSDHRPVYSQLKFLNPEPMELCRDLRLHGWAHISEAAGCLYQDLCVTS